MDGRGCTGDEIVDMLLSKFALVLVLSNRCARGGHEPTLGRLIGKKCMFGRGLDYLRRD